MAKIFSWWLGCNWTSFFLLFSPHGQFVCLGAVWVWWLNWYGLILSIVPTQRAAGSALCVSILPASHWFVLKQPGRQFVLSELNPIRQSCVREGQGSASSARCHSLLMTFPQTHTGHRPMNLTSVWPDFSVKQRFPLQSSGANSALVVSFPNHTFPRVCFLGFLFPLVVFLSLHSLSVLLIVLHASAEWCQ